LEKIEFKNNTDSRSIKYGIMALCNGCDKIVDNYNKFPGIDLRNDKFACALQKVSKIRSVKLKNLSLRVINGDIYSRERMFRFGMTDENKCSRCNQTESSVHLLLECPTAQKIWRIFSNICIETGGQEFSLTLANVINCNYNYNSVATSTIIAELNRINIHLRLEVVSDDLIRKFIRNLIKKEIRSVSLNRTKLEKSWTKWVNWYHTYERSTGSLV
jgi:hypothetical protein